MGEVVRQDWETVCLGGADVDLLGEAAALELIFDHALHDTSKPIAVISANLDHIHHFGAGGTWFGVKTSVGDQLTWLTLLDGAPLAARAASRTGSDWPRLAGSDLIDPVLERSATSGLRVGFLGGTEHTHEMAAAVLRRKQPDLKIAGWWAPLRDDLRDAGESRKLAAEIKRAAVDVLFVGLGKPRQEVWIAEYGLQTGAKVFLAFGAAIDFLAGSARRAPGWVRENGLEWAWRLAKEPRRLGRRYLLQGPPALWKLYRCGPAPDAEARSRDLFPALDPPSRATATQSRFVAPSEPADIAVLVVTYNNERHLGPLLDSLRAESTDLALRVIVADNDSVDETLSVLSAHPDVICVETGGNLGYAAGINHAIQSAGDSDFVLVLNPDVIVARGALRAMLDRCRKAGVGAVVPRIMEKNSSIHPSLRREPSVSGSLGDALLGWRLRGRPGALSEAVLDPEAYEFPHAVDWATGAAILVRSSLAEQLGAWDESFFLYSEEVDYCRRIRQAGASIWFEPSATIIHDFGGSGRSAKLEALMAVNKIRYASMHHGPARAGIIRGIEIIRACVRANRTGESQVLRVLVDKARWNSLPGPSARRARAGAISSESDANMSWQAAP